MPFFNRVRHRILCIYGRHHGNNFCAFCGKQLVPQPFWTFRVTTIDGKMVAFVKALDGTHAKRQLRRQYPPSQLIAERVTEDER